MLNIVLFGAPGAGKGTQAALLAGEHNLEHLSTGEILRKEIAAGSELGKQAQRFINRGEFVADEVVIDIIREQIEQHPEAKGFIFDGFPRTTAQAEALDRLMTEKNMRIASMVALEVEAGELINRLLKRGASSGRADDQSLEVIRNRIEGYRQKTEPIIDYYRAQKKYRSLDGTGDVASIFDRLRKHVKEL